MAYALSRWIAANKVNNVLYRVLIGLDGEIFDDLIVLVRSVGIIKHHCALAGVRLRKFYLTVLNLVRGGGQTLLDFFGHCRLEGVGLRTRKFLQI